MFSDIDECLKPGACGSNAICINSVGNHTCQCLEGFSGNPYNGVILYLLYYLLIPSVLQKLNHWKGNVEKWCSFNLL